MSRDEWDLYSSCMQREFPYLADNSVITNQLTSFCKNFATPLLQRQEAQRHTSRIVRTFWLPERHFDGTSSLEILERFSDYKKQSPTKIVQRYIIDARIREEEARLVAKLSR